MTYNKEAACTTKNSTKIHKFDVSVFWRKKHSNKTSMIKMATPITTQKIQSAFQNYTEEPKTLMRISQHFQNLGRFIAGVPFLIDQKNQGKIQEKSFYLVNFKVSTDFALWILLDERIKTKVKYSEYDFLSEYEILTKNLDTQGLRFLYQTKGVKIGFNYTLNKLTETLKQKFSLRHPVMKFQSEIRELIEVHRIIYDKTDQDYVRKKEQKVKEIQEEKLARSETKTNKTKKEQANSKEIELDPETKKLYHPISTKTKMKQEDLIEKENNANYQTNQYNSPEQNIGNRNQTKSSTLTNSKPLSNNTKILNRDQRVLTRSSAATPNEHFTKNRMINKQLTKNSKSGFGIFIDEFQKEDHHIIINENEMYSEPRKEHYLIEQRIKTQKQIEKIQQVRQLLDNLKVHLDLQVQTIKRRDQKKTKSMITNNDLTNFTSKNSFPQEEIQTFQKKKANQKRRKKSQIKKKGELKKTFIYHHIDGPLYVQKISFVIDSSFPDFLNLKKLITTKMNQIIQILKNSPVSLNYSFINYSSSMTTNQKIYYKNFSSNEWVTKTVKKDEIFNIRDAIRVIKDFSWENGKLSSIYHFCDTQKKNVKVKITENYLQDLKILRKKNIRYHVIELGKNLTRKNHFFGIQQIFNHQKRSPIRYRAYYTPNNNLTNMSVKKGFNKENESIDGGDEDGMKYKQENQKENEKENENENEIEIRNENENENEKNPKNEIESGKTELRQNKNEKKNHDVENEYNGDEDKNTNKERNNEAKKNINQNPNDKGCEEYFTNYNSFHDLWNEIFAYISDKIDPKYNFHKSENQSKKLNRKPQRDFKNKEYVKRFLNFYRYCFVDIFNDLKPINSMESGYCYEKVNCFYYCDCKEKGINSSQFVKKEIPIGVLPYCYQRTEKNDLFLFKLTNGKFLIGKINLKKKKHSQKTKFNDYKEEIKNSYTIIKYSKEWNNLHSHYSIIFLNKMIIQFQTKTSPHYNYLLVAEPFINDGIIWENFRWNMLQPNEKHKIKLDELNAFEHFVYKRSNKKMFIQNKKGIDTISIQCGVHSSPKIFTRDNYEKQKKKNSKSFEKFFESKHKCNDLCLKLKLSDPQTDLKIIKVQTLNKKEKQYLNKYLIPNYIF
ncbi:retinitis pigmentosa gtpase regulator a-related [Anaeramoeba flamelloides]|uniref:Retinitis pigmentosa gtpase regulator a-related n=1 Tax=Anaeramoeba flamelloides TaxID=1746091 RepID=A0AAV7ZER4_9EUKA|nr:retinitis pigmentosa gtpase regulator a-related [Anaeramoeba flamelloides]